MRANEQQIGGRHYKTTYEHWDLVLNTGMGYLEGQATKYVARWRKKNGMEDLKKALHYVNKLIENWPLLKRQKDFTVISAQVTEFATANRLKPIETGFFMKMATWEDGGDLDEAQLLLMEIMNEADPLPVPLEDSNKHADRQPEN